MKKIIIEINTTNDVFNMDEDQYGANYEVARILDVISRKLKSFHEVGENIRDTNGNIVGSIKIE